MKTDMKLGYSLKNRRKLCHAIIFFEECLPVAVAKRCFAKKVFLKVSENSRRRTCAVITFFDKVICCWAASCGSLKLVF